MSSTPGDPNARRSSTNATTVISIIGGLVGVLGVAFVVRILVRDWDDIREAIAAADLAVLGVAVVVGIAGMGWVGFQWPAVLRSIGSDRVRAAPVMRSYYIGQLGKYVPGGVWPVLGRAELLVRTGVTRRFAYPSVGLSMAITYLAAIVLSAVLTPLAWSDAGSSQSWIMLTLPFGLIALHPAILGRIMGLCERLFAEGEPTTVPAWRTALLLVLRHVPTWILISAATWIVARSLHIDVGFVPIAFATPLAWAAGLAALPVPGGIGVREAIFVALMSGSVGSSNAATIAVTARLAFIGGDLLAALVASLAIPAPGRVDTT